MRIISSLIILLTLASSSYGQSVDSLFQLVHYIWVEDGDKAEFEENLLVDREGLADGMVQKGLIVSWHLFKNLAVEEADTGSYLQVMTLTRHQVDNPQLETEIEAVASEVLGAKKDEILKRGTDLISDIREEFWTELDRMYMGSSSQIFDHLLLGFMQSIPSGSMDYVAMETEVWKPAIQYGMEQSLLTGWTLASIKKSALDISYDYVAVDLFDSQEEMQSAAWNDWLVAAHPQGDLKAMNERTDSVRSFVKGIQYELISWAGKE